MEEQEKEELIEQKEAEAKEEIRENLSKEDIIGQLEVLAKNEDAFSVRKEVKNLMNNFSELTRAEKDLQEKAFYNKEDKEEGEKFEFVSNPLDNRFVELKNIYNDNLDKAKAQKKKEEKENFETKKALLEELKTLVESGMQNAGSAFQKFYEIRDNWDATGEVNKANFKELQSDYSLYRDKFYYNVDIFNELKSYDFKKNGEQKNAVIDELQQLQNQPSIKKMEQTVKELQSKWDQIGPTSNEQWENLKNRYWDNVNAVYEKIKEHYQAMRDKQALALENKTNLAGQLEILNTELDTYNSPQQWSEVNNIVNELHNKWKAEDYAGKGKEDTLWEKFSALTDEVRSKASTYFGALKDENKRIEDAKEKLIAKAEEIKNSTDWRNTTQAFIKLQNDWKQIGQTVYKKDQELWEKFRGVCDEFFTAKKHYFDTLDDRQEENLKVKNDIAKKIAESANKAELEALIKEWQTVGYVPKKEIKNADNLFNASVQKAAKKLELQGESIQNIKFKAKIEAIKEDDNAGSKLKSERRFVQGKIEKLKEEINRYEENMSFFGNSKGSLKLKEVVEKKIAVSVAELENWEKKLKMLK
ncbi:MAG: DUF349 domain-containing protein [Chitinophagales bacterium]|nr:DUF349 domain-containing protein [Chitinophagales bacterium]